MDKQGIFMGKNGQLHCYAQAGKYKLNYFVKHKLFRDFNCLTQHLKAQNCQLLSYVELSNGTIKASIRYREVN